MAGSTTLFLCYAAEDSDIVRDLERHLTPLQHQRLISVWHERMIQPGQDWRTAIIANIKLAQIILLIVSSDFLASVYCSDGEVAQALLQQAAGQAAVIPILIRPADWQSTWFGHLQPLPRSRIPISQWEDRDFAWFNVAVTIKQQLEGPSESDRPITTLLARSGGSKLRQVVVADDLRRDDYLDKRITLSKSVISILAISICIIVPIFCLFSTKLFSTFHKAQEFTSVLAARSNMVLAKMIAMERKKETLRQCKENNRFGAYEKLQHYAASERERFQKLHHEHVSAIENSHFILAHELVGEIHDLMTQYEHNLAAWSCHTEAPMVDSELLNHSFYDDDNSFFGHKSYVQISPKSDMHKLSARLYYLYEANYMPADLLSEHKLHLSAYAYAIELTRPIGLNDDELPSLIYPGVPPTNSLEYDDYQKYLIEQIFSVESTLSTDASGIN